MMQSIWTLSRDKRSCRVDLKIVVYRILWEKYMNETELLILRRLNKNDANSLFEYAQDPDVGKIVDWLMHKCVKYSLNVIAREVLKK